MATPTNNITVPVYRERGEQVQLRETVRLRAVFKDQNGDLVELDSLPQITIIQPSGLISVGPTTVGVSMTSPGNYLYEYAIGPNGPLGVWVDNWRGTFGSITFDYSFNFVVAQTQLPTINSDGYLHLGDDVGYNYSQIAIHNINKLLKGLEARLNNRGKVKKKDAFGNDIYVDCNYFSIDMLVAFLALSLSEFNMIPFFTNFTFDDTDFIDLYLEIIIEGATLYSLASKALVERGREYNISDNGIQFTPPTVSDMMNTQYSSLLSVYNERLKTIKNSMRPFPKGMGTATTTTSNVVARRLRHLRARRLF